MEEKVLFWEELIDPVVDELGPDLVFLRLNGTVDADFELHLL